MCFPVFWSLNSANLFRGSNGNETVIHSHYLASIVASTLYLLATSCSVLPRGPSLCSCLAIESLYKTKMVRHKAFALITSLPPHLLLNATPLSMCCVWAPVWASTCHLAWFSHMIVAKCMQGTISTPFITNDVWSYPDMMCIQWDKVLFFLQGAAPASLSCSSAAAHQARRRPISVFSMPPILPLPHC